MFFEKLKAEFVGSFILCLGFNLAWIQYCYHKLDEIALSVTCFIVYCQIMWVIKPLSKAQLIPTITLPMIITSHIHYIDGIFCILFQFLGAIFAAAITKIAVPIQILQDIEKNTTLGHPYSNSHHQIEQILFEGMASFLVVLAYYLLVLEHKCPKYVYAPGVAGMYFVANLFLVDKTGAGLNPAWVFGLCLMQNHFMQMTTVVFGCFLGGMMGALMGGIMLSE